MPPMAGISSSPYRQLARRFGAAVVYSEMVSSNGLVYKSGKTNDMLRFTDLERPIGIQLFGANPGIMFRAVQYVSKWNPDLIDLNFGCPVKKVVNKNGGAAILKDMGLLRELIEAAVKGSYLPVTVKLRSGWDETTKVFIEAGKVAEKAGVAAITLHARSRSKLFSGNADWGDIKSLKGEVSVPVIGNGDITSGEDAREMLDLTGCDGVMVGRAAIGNPWIFREINHYLETGDNLPAPDLAERVATILEHGKLMIEDVGEKRAMFKMRGIFPKYSRGWVNAAAMRKAVSQITDYVTLENLLQDYLDKYRGVDLYAPDPA